MMRVDWWLIAGAAIVIILIGVVLANAGEPNRGAWFKSLLMPGTKTSCCDVSDCKRTEAKWIGEGWLANVQGHWRPIPKEKVLINPKSLDGDAYVCSAPMVPSVAANATIFCFIPPDMGY